MPTPNYKPVTAYLVTPNGDTVVDEANDAIRVNAVAGGTSGTQYTEGDTDATITGTAVMWEDAADTLRPISAAKPLPVNVVAGGAGGGAVTVADAADVAEGATTDAAVTTDVAGTISGKLRGLVKWAFERMPASLGQKTMAASLGVTVASDQSAIPVTDNGGSLTIDGTVGVSGAVTVDSELTTADLDTGAGTDTRAVVGLVGAASGGGALIEGTAANGLEVDVTRVQGNVTVIDGGGALSVDDNGASLTVDGTVAATQSGTWTVTATHPVTGIADGRKVVATAGTREALAASTACKKVDIQAELDNTGVVVVGGTTVVAALATRRGITLYPGDTYSLEIDNLNDVNLDVTVSGDGVTYTYYT